MKDRRYAQILKRAFPIAALTESRASRILVSLSASYVAATGEPPPAQKFASMFRCAFVTHPDPRRTVGARDANSKMSASRKTIEYETRLDDPGNRAHRLR